MPMRKLNAPKDSGQDQKDSKRKLKMKSKAEEFLFVSDDNKDYIQEPKVIFRSGLAQYP